MPVPDRLAQVDHLDARARARGSEGRFVAAVVVGEDDERAFRQHREAIDIGLDGRRQHDARPVIVGKDQRPFDRARAEHDPFRADAPQALPHRAFALGERHMIAEALQPDEIVVVVVTGDRRSRQHLDVLETGQRMRRARNPFASRLAVDLCLADQQAPAELALHVRQDHAGPRPARLHRRAQPRGTRADDQEIAVGMAALVVLGIGVSGRAAQAAHAANEFLVDAVPPRTRPHERLVVEAGRKELRKQTRKGADVDAKARPAVLAFRDEPFEELGLGRPHVRFPPSALAQRDQGVWLLHARAQDPSRAVVLEAPGDQMHPVREQGRRERIARVSGVAHPVEPKTQHAVPLDPAAPRQSKLLGHGLRSPGASGRSPGA